MSNYPDKLNDILQDFSMISDRNERAEYLIEIADRFPEAKVPPDIATEPYDESHRVPACESEAFVWALDNPDGTIKYYFDVLNPQGLSAKAMCAVLDETCSGQPLDKVASLQTDIVFNLFGKEISMGKGQGLMGIVNMVMYEAKKRLN
ncbi:MAG: SufE family protein [Chloroflexi bacterium]|nr:SufE family protein [Chloroflexota bacterium]MCC6894950.1 SufE family protein [Anaerolineae bacterium]